jgi:hypothetical protein
MRKGILHFFASDQFIRNDHGSILRIEIVLYFNKEKVGDADEGEKRDEPSSVCAL